MNHIDFNVERKYLLRLKLILLGKNYEESGSDYFRGSDPIFFVERSPDPNQRNFVLKI